MSFEKRINEFKSLIENSKHIVFFGGAGVSTASGIPDFRSEDGLYNKVDEEFTKYKPEYLLSRHCLYVNTKVFYDFYRKKMDCRNIQPNIAHIKLAELEKTGKRISVITQNIDGLHEKAGSTEIYNIHGTTSRNYCTKCNAEYPIETIFDSTEEIPRCTKCSQFGIIRPDVTLYGETLPKAFTEATKVINEADLMIVAGTSLSVYPAASLVSYFDGPLVIINRDDTSIDDTATLVFKESISEVFNNI